jgi:deferrochelatase/peroxidase EfeB
MRARFTDVQRVVLCGGGDKGRPWPTAQHLVLGFGTQAQVLHFLESLKAAQLWPTRVGDGTPPEHLQVSLGFSRRGLERAQAPPFPIGAFAIKAPAFSAGAALRGPTHAGAHGRNAPAYWDKPVFGFETLDAVLGLHATDDQYLTDATKALHAVASKYGVAVESLPRTAWLYDKQGEPSVHFGYRDNLSVIGIEGWTRDSELKRLKDVSHHAAGEFLLGHPQDSGANPWLASGAQVWPERLRGFFHNASFGVVHQVEQNVTEFDRFIKEAAHKTRLDADTIRAKLCGRAPDGRPAGHGHGTDPTADHDYTNDKDGFGCPYGAHTRRMNPRDGTPRAHTRPRPLLRRGMPYTDGASRGLLGLFFCASIEDQFEHLLGQWGDRVPLGGDDPGGARDPLIGAHQPGDGPFVIPMGEGRTPIVLRDLPAFTRTRGTAYLFFPSLSALEQITAGLVFPLGEKDDEP